MAMPSLFVPDLAIVGSISKQQLLILAQKSGCVSIAFVPQQHGPAARDKNADKLAAGFFPVEPVSGLGRGNDVHAVIVQRSRFSASRNTGDISAVELSDLIVDQIGDVK